MERLIAEAMLKLSTVDAQKNPEIAVLRELNSYTFEQSVLFGCKWKTDS